MRREAHAKNIFNNFALKNRESTRTFIAGAAPVYPPAIPSAFRRGRSYCPAEVQWFHYSHW